jgi:lipopolysaccharide/colanic/teichoic acid biosynthesis glycosyltransferase
MRKGKFRIISVIGDIVLLTISFIIVFLAKPSTVREQLPEHGPVFLSLVFVWLLVSVLYGKFLRGKIVNVNSLFYRVVFCNLISVLVIAVIVLIFKHFEYSKTIILGTALLATMLELIVGGLFLAYKRAAYQNFEELNHLKTLGIPSEYELINGKNGNNHHDFEIHEINQEVIAAIEYECGAELTKAILNISGKNLTDRTAVLSTTTVFNIAGLPIQKYDYIINLHRINDIKRLDDFLDAVNRKLEMKGYFLCCVETKDQRKSSFLNRYPPVLNYLFYTIDFIIKRVFPKFKITHGLFQFLTKGQNAVISRAEALGRLSRAGFRIKQEAFIENLLCIEAKKAAEPLSKNGNFYSTLIALPRVGQDGKIIKVYKLRTMHPYSEYIQDYVYSLYDLRKGGKFKNDFRITSWGSVCRKTWLDEIPMFINILRGDMKLVGIRPLSQQYFDLYSDDVKDRRIKYKPGLIPPFYADMPVNLEEIQASEMKYLDEYDKRPVLTDFRYFMRSMKNILFRNARSK